LLSNNQLVAVSQYNEPRPRLMGQCPEGEIFSWSIVPPTYTLSHSVEVLLAVDKTVYVVDAIEAEDKLLQNGPFKHLSVSPTGRFVALVMGDGKLWVVSSDFQNKYCEYESKAKTPPLALEWCADDSVILAWEDEIHMVGPNGAASR
jgi:vacuolar protein sorting-associated protein 16